MCGTKPRFGIPSKHRQTDADSPRARHLPHKAAELSHNFYTIASIIRLLQGEPSRSLRPPAVNMRPGARLIAKTPWPNSTWESKAAAILVSVQVSLDDLDVEAGWSRDPGPTEGDQMLDPPGNNPFYCMQSTSLRQLWSRESAARRVLNGLLTFVRRMACTNFGHQTT